MTTQVTLWQSGSGNFYVADVSDLARNSGVWYRIPRLLHIPLVDFVSLLLDYGASLRFNRESGNLIYWWGESDYSKANKFKLDMNKKLRGQKI